MFIRVPLAEGEYPYKLVNTDHVIYSEASGSSVVVYLTGGKEVLVSLNLEQFEILLFQNMVFNSPDTAQQAPPVSMMDPASAT